MSGNQPTLEGPVSPMEISPISDASIDPFPDIRDAWELHMSRTYGDAAKQITLLDDGDDDLLTLYVQFLLVKVLHDKQAPRKPWTDHQVAYFSRAVRQPSLVDLLPDIINAIKKLQWFEACQLLREQPRRPTIDEEKYTNSLVRDWEAAYQGKTCKAFIDEIQMVMRNKKVRTHAYSQSINIIQSSGMGKSRLVKELSQHLFSWTFTLRRAGEDGFPKGDDEVYAFLTKDSASDKYTHPRAIALLGGTFSLMSAELSHGLKAYEFTDFLADWNRRTAGVTVNGRNPDRELLIKRILDVAEDIRKKLKHTNFGRNKWSSDAGFNYTGDEYIRGVLIRPLIEIHDLLPIERRSKGLDIPRICLLNFDETANLIDGDADGRYIALRRVLGSLVHQCVWATFLSTDSRIQVFAPKKAQDQSGRISLGAKKRLPPFSAFQLNIENTRIEAKNQQEELQRPIGTFGTIKHLCLFGRPLWKAYSDGGADSVCAVVKNKLILNTEFDPRNPDHAFATISFRICLDPVLEDVSAEFVMKAVQCHLRVLKKISYHTRIIETMTSSEPLVAHAAALLLNDCPQPGRTNWARALETVTTSLLETGKIEKGNRGELLSRVLLTLAHDAVGRRKKESGDSIQGMEIMQYSRPIQVADFFEQFLGLSLDEIKDRTQPLHTRSTRSGHSLSLDGFFQGYITFNHFAQRTTNLRSSGLTNVLIKLLRQQAALQLAHCQPTWDILIPVFCGDADEPLQPEKVSAILIQVKNRDTAASFKLGPEYAQMFGMLKQPLVVVQMELGLQTPVDRVDAFKITNRLPTDTDTSNAPYIVGIAVKGCTNRVYPVLRDEEVHSACMRLRRCVDEAHGPGTTADAIIAELNVFDNESFPNPNMKEPDTSDNESSYEEIMPQLEADIAMGEAQ